jgi:hypothetical protein
LLSAVKDVPDNFKQWVEDNEERIGVIVTDTP